MPKTKQLHQSGFTLVELLIVVIILAILAAIVVPQFSASTDDARAAAQDSNTAAFRQAVNLYYQQHGVYPGANTAVPAGTCSGTAAPAGATAGTAAAVIAQLTSYTNELGGACSAAQVSGAVAYRYGPYLSEIPVNSNNGSATIATPVTTGDLLLAPATSATDGWTIDITSGVVVANVAP